MDDQIFGGAPVEPNEPKNEEPLVPETNETEQVNEEVTEPVAEQHNEPVESEHVNTQPENAGEYHYNRHQYNQQFGGFNNNSQNYNQPQYNYNNYSQPQNNMNGYGYNQPNQNYTQQPGYSQFNNENKPPRKKNAGMKVFVGIIIAIVVLSVALVVAVFSGDGNIITPSDKESVSGSVDNNKHEIDNVGSIDLSDSSNKMGDAVTVANVAKKFNVGILVYAKNQLYTEGSGVILKEDSDGKYTYIVTCAHVVNYSGVALSVLMEDGTEYPADLVGMDSRTDLAVVRIEAKDLPKAEVADSDALVVGQTVYAIGNPGGSEFFGSVTNGIISAIDRPVSSSTGYEMECIQHTSAINPGNSGGALVNGEGKLIGINSMKIASTEYEGMGFSVPSSVMIDVFNSIIENGYVAGRAKLGIQYATPSNYSQTYSMYVQMKGLPSGTIVIASVSEDSDLADKDVKEGDMIIAVNGKEMKTPDMLSEMIEDMSAGDSLTLTIVRVNTDDWSQTERDITVKLVEDTGVANTQAPQENTPSQGSGNPYGDQYQDWYDFYREFFGY
ncbi:MAG: trypsin-like peptidase domain-containing protein [Clostridia bacterium]|nr:trypsin-like peptidase domain-containing protein [Clostridia bacterium]